MSMKARILFANSFRLEPILYRIKQKRSAILCPTIDSIDDKTMAYHGSGDAGYGIFTWSLFFNWGSMPDRVRSQRKSHVDPYPSPTMAGGLLAADRKYFFEIGGYDDGMVKTGKTGKVSFSIKFIFKSVKFRYRKEVWGGENLELSFRVIHTFDRHLIDKIGD